MLSALERGLAPHCVVPIAIGLPVHADALYRLNRLDYVILGGGTLISEKPCAPFDTFDQWAEQLGCPIGVAGLGVDSVLEPYWPAVDALLNRAEFFYVRDRASHNVLGGHAAARVSPDLTFAYPLAQRDGHTVAPTNLPLCGVHIRSAGDLDPAPWLETIAQLPVRVRGIPFSSFEVFGETALLRQLDPACPARFDAARYDGLDLMIGTAFHSILFAVQAGIPVIAISYAPKVHSFMHETGLGRYLLAPDEHHKLPTLLNDVLAHRSEIALDLRRIRETLVHQAQQTLEMMRLHIERRGPRPRRRGPKATIVVLNSGIACRDTATLHSCVSQTYPNVDVLVSPTGESAPPPDAPSQAGVRIVDVAPGVSYGVRLQHAIEQAEGEYVTWVDGGDVFAKDAVDCLVSLLETDQSRDVVYTDYRVIDAEDRHLGHESVPAPDRLFRRDVVGPCFLARRALLERVGRLAVDAPLVTYDLWLRARSSSQICPFHATLFHSTRQVRDSAFIEKERETRRQWRRSQPPWVRAIWGLIDTDFGERFIVKPSARVLRFFKGAFHGDR